MNEHHFSRQVFSQSRLAEFADREGLERQTGHPAYVWPLAILKELVDNSLDACEGAGIAPVIKVTVTDLGITVEDNGPGIAVGTIEHILDFDRRTSSNAVYAAPTRGQQGNAFQTLLAMPFAATGKPASTVITSQGIEHTITFDIDPITREPVITHRRKCSSVRKGARIFIPWTRSINYGSFYTRVAHYQWFNPHLTVSLEWERTDDDRVASLFLSGGSFAASDPTWHKWLPSNPSPSTWYSIDRFRGLMAAEIDKAQRESLPMRTVADFIGQFRGLSSTVKRSEIAKSIGIARMPLDDFFAKGDGHAAMLLDELAKHGKPVKPHDLGVIGEAHLRELFGTTKPASFQYRKVEVISDDDIPFLIEVAFAWAPDFIDRLLVAGLNWSITVQGDPFQSLSTDDEGDVESLDTILTDNYAGEDEPIEFFLHVASPGLSFLDRGKNKVNLPVEVDKAIVEAVLDVTKKWTKQRKAEEKDASAARRRDQKLARAEKPASIKDAAYAVMSDAYAAASDNNTLPANARQVMYAARPDIIETTGEEVLNDSYFTQTLLPDYMNENREETKDWDIVWSDRGHFTEPHDGERFGLGTLATRAYLKSYTDAPVMKSAGFNRPKSRHMDRLAAMAGCSTSKKKGLIQSSRGLNWPQSSISRS